MRARTLFGKLLAVALLVITSALFGQDQEVAKRIYRTSEDAVFLVYLNDSSGKPEALGSAFLVAPRTLITNAHVVNDGTPVLAVGPVRIPVTVVARDTDNDLAILSVNADLTSKPLLLANEKPSPGEKVYAIGNPEGLEKTISEGLVSGVRNLDKRVLLQVTSPISHGSSGGPILNSDGQVIGVAVGMLTDGQNLNFAVPVSYVRDLINRKSVAGSTLPHVGIYDLLATAAKLKTETYSGDDGSTYQQDLHLLTNSAQDLLTVDQNAADLEKLSCLGTENWAVLDQGLSAAKRLYQLQHTRDNGALLAYNLLQKASSDDISAAFDQDGSPDKAAALAAKTLALDELIKLATSASTQIGSHDAPLYNFALAGAKRMEEDYAAAVVLNQATLPRISTVCGIDVKDQIYRDLIFETEKLGHPDQAESWFRRYSNQYSPSDTDWDAEGDRRDAAGDYDNAAAANEKAASQNGYYGIDYCWAAQEYFLSGSEQSGHVLEDGRKCIDASVKNTSDQRTKQFAERLPNVYRFMATVLERRGVHQAALDYIKESLAASPADPNSLYEEALIFSSLEHYSECVSAARAAITASDGKFRWMHFGLGNCYFDKEDWNSAAASFRIAAEDDKTDASSAFNLALCLEHEGFTSDAKIWFGEALKRNPRAELREKILNAIK